MQTRAVFFKPGFTGLTASKPGYPGTRVYDYVSPAGGGRPTVGHLSEVDSRVGIAIPDLNFQSRDSGLSGA